MNVLSIHNLKKSFNNHVVFEHLSFQVEEGSIFGFLGQNGAGKTTTMKMILGFLPADEGTIDVMGERVHFGETTTNRLIGYLPDVPEFYNLMTAHEYLDLCGDVMGMTVQKKHERMTELLSLVGLDTVTKRIGSYSRGMKQRLGIAQALLGEPKLLICDEPTSALDPIGRKEILDILLAAKQKTTIIFSTHILSDVEKICDHVAILHHGSLVIQGALSDLVQSKTHETLEVQFDTLVDLQTIRSHPLVVSYPIEEKTDQLSLFIQTKDFPTLNNTLYQVFQEKHIYPKKMEVVESTLEDLFLEVVK